MEIVYCGGCGKALHRDDFDRDRAFMLDNRPWCFECRPPDKTPISPLSASAETRKSGSSPKHARIVVGTGRHQAIRPPTNKPLLVAIGVAAVVIVAVGLAVMGSSTPAPTVGRVSKAPTEPGRPAKDTSDADRAIKELESFASLAPPEKVLARCEELHPRIRGTPQERRFLEIEAAARDQKKAREQEAQLAKELDALRTVIDADPRFGRYEEVVRRLKAAREIAGSRGAELDRRLADYQRLRQESPHEKHAGPFDADEQGFVRKWLVLGVFSNDKDKGFDTDYLQPETTQDPVEGLAVGTLKWSAHASPEPRIDFFRVAHLGIKKPRDWVVAYAACLVQLPDDVAAVLRVGSDDGSAICIDGKWVGKNHKQRGLKIDEDSYAVPLSRGLHRVLVKVENHERGFEFALRLVTADGSPIPGLRIWN
jgi:hypothetical protein